MATVEVNLYMCGVGKTFFSAYIYIYAVCVSGACMYKYKCVCVFCVHRMSCGVAAADFGTSRVACRQTSAPSHSRTRSRLGSTRRHPTSHHQGILAFANR
jgi:hypothetical protein